MYSTFLLETLINSSSISLDYFGFLYLWSYHLHITTILIRYACFSLPNYIGYNIRLNRSGDRNQPFLVADFKRKSFNASPLSMMLGFPGKESTCKAGDPSSIPGLGRSTGEGIGYPLQYSFFFSPLRYSWASLVAQMVKNLPSVSETWVQSLAWEDPWRRRWLPIPVFWPREFHGQRSLAGYRPGGPKELDMTEQLSLATITINRSLNYPWVSHFHPFTFNTSVCLEWTSCK